MYKLYKFISKRLACVVMARSLSEKSAVFPSLSFILPFFLLLSSCFHKEDFDMQMLASKQNHPYDLAIPLLSSHLRIEDFTSLESENIYMDENNLVHLIFRNANPVQYRLSDYIRISDQNLVAYLSPAIPYFKKDTSFTITYVDSVLFYMPGNIELDKILLDSCTLYYKMNNMTGAAISVQVKVLNMYQENGASFTINEPLSAFGLKTNEVFLPNSQIVFQDPAVPKIYYQVSLSGDMSKASNEDIRLGQIAIDMAIRQVSYKRIYGYVGKNKIDFSSEIKLAGIDSRLVNGFNFQKADLKMYTDNGATLPIRVDNSQAYVYFPDKPKQEVQLYPLNYNIPYPQPNDVPFSKKDEVSANIQPLLTEVPNAAGVGVSLLINPDDDRSIRNVIDRNSTLYFDFLCDIPMWLSVDKYKVLDTFDFKPIERVDDIKRFYLRSVVKNAFPIEVSVGFHFLSEDNRILFTVLDDQLIPGGEIGPAPDYKVIKPTVSYVDIDLTVEQIRKLAQAHKIYLFGSLSTTNKDVVKIYMGEDQGYMDVKLGARALFNVGSFLNKK